MNISGKFWNSHEFYNLSQHGKEQLRSCLKKRKPHIFHSACSRSDFYEIASPSFEDLPIVVNSAFENVEYVQATFESNIFSENVTISNLDGQDDLSSVSEDPLFDPCPMYEGSTLKNIEGYLCFLNSISNGLLSLKSFRKLIQFMEPKMKEFFTNILNGEMRHLERLRVALHKFNANFPPGRQSDACEALNQLILLMNLDNLFQISQVEIKRKQKCEVCNDEITFSVNAPHGSPNILILEQSNEKNVQDEVDNYIRKLKNVHSNDVYCTKCDEYATMTLSDCLQTNEIVIIRIHRFSNNFIKIDKDVIPTFIIQIGSYRYRLRCYISHHGQSAEVGHYTSTIPKGNNFLTFDDEKRIEKTKCTKDPYILFYEKIETDDGESEGEGELNDLFECRFCDENEFTNQQSLEKHEVDVHQFLPNNEKNILGESKLGNDKPIEDPVPETTGPSPLDISNNINESEILDLESVDEAKSDEISQIESGTITFIYPRGTIEQFTKKASNYKDEDSERREVIAYLAGYKCGDSLIGTELIFPDQLGSSHFYHDKILDIGNKTDYDTKDWILINSWTAKKYHGKQTIMARIHSVVNGKKFDRLSSNDVHIQSKLEKRFGHFHSIIVEIDHEDPTNRPFCSYTLTNMGHQQLVKCNKSDDDLHEGCDEVEFFQEAYWVEGKNPVKVLDFDDNVMVFTDLGLLHKGYYDEKDKELKKASSVEIARKRMKSHSENIDEVPSAKISKESYENENSFEEESLKNTCESIDEVSFEEEKIACKVCNKCFSNGFQGLISHLNSNSKKPCKPKYIDNKNMMDELMQNYETGEGKELISCISCNTLKPIDQIKKHIIQNKKDNCMNEYVSKGELIQLEVRIAQYKNNQKYQSNLGRTKEQIKKANDKKTKEQIKKDNDKRTQEQIKKDNDKRTKEQRKKEKKTKEQIKKDNDKRTQEQIARSNEKRSEDSVKRFNEKQQTGLDYICVCCCTVRFRRGVQELTKKLKNQITDEKRLGHCLSISEKFKFDDKYWIHHNCARLLKNGKIPDICFNNYLWNNDIPAVFKEATLIEKLAVKKKIPFIKIRDLPTSRMKYMWDRVINVPISDSDVLKTALTLPRMNDKLGTINVAMKRYMKSRRYYKEPELIRPKVINEMLTYLKAHHNSYKEFPIELLSESSKYRFITLPLVGEDETDENLLNVTQAFEQLVPPVLESLELKFDAIASTDADCFLRALLEQFR